MNRRVFLMAHAFKSQPEPTIYLQGGEAVFNGFRDSDPDLTEILRDAEDIESAGHRVVQVGAKAIRLAQVNIDTALVEDAFAGMTREFDKRVGEAVASIAETTQGLLDEDTGALPTALDGWKEEVSELLGATFDPDSKRSVLTKLENVLEKAGQQQLDAVRRVLNPDRDDSPLSHWRADILRALTDHSGTLLKAVNDLSQKIVVQEAQAEIFEMTSLKGATFEERLHEVITSITARYGDIAEFTGRSSGLAGNQKGDEVVRINPEDTRGEETGYVLELKDRKSRIPLRVILEELDAARANRGVPVAIAIFSNQKRAPLSVPFQVFGDKAVLVYDKENPDDRVLELACMWARWVARRKLGEQGESINADRISALIDDACRSLERAATIRRCHTAAKKKIEEAAGQVSHLVDDVGIVLGEIRNEIEKP